MTQQPETGFMAGLRREFRRMGKSRAYLFGMIFVPVLVAVTFLSLLGEGLPRRVPTTVVDLDHTPLSRSVVRTLNSNEMIDLVGEAESYDAALAQVRRGESFGFFVIPANFEKDALSLRTPTLSYYTNMTYFVPGTLAFKGFKTIAVTVSGGVVKTALQDLGVSDQAMAGLLQPVSIDNYELGNPWMNYSIYLTPSFAIGAFALMILLMTVYSITMEIKDGTSPGWLRTCGGHLPTALLSKMLPHTAIYVATGTLLLWLLFGYAHFPSHGSLLWLWIGMVLFVIANQAFALTIVCLLPNPRLSFSICALFGVLTFSFAGFSFPVESMYGGVGVFSWLAPTRYLFLIYINNALNGYSVWFVRWWFVALLAFPAVAALATLRLKKALEHPVYVP
ncbi:MAG: ABC transporter permease [Muribaculaceae bacterium]|nr:ABC transporter permease [Muribaculaceae bacterium]